MKYLSLNEAAEQLGVSTKTIRRRIADGTLAAYRVSGSRLIRVSAPGVAALLRPIRTVRTAAPPGRRPARTTWGIDEPQKAAEADARAPGGDAA